MAVRVTGLLLFFAPRSSIDRLASFVFDRIAPTTSNADQGVAPKDLSSGGSDGTGKEPTHG